MCGICGVHTSRFDRSGSLEEQIKAMNTLLSHRGPDDQGHYFNGYVGLSMRRLAVIDVEGGHQPVVNETGTVVVTFNGEIYNFEMLREQLAGSGHVFRTMSDTEVIVHAYEEWGDAALDRFNGMFAIALWDEPNKRLLLARDRMGKKPLYWSSTPGGFLWASEIKAILASNWVDRRVCPEALHHYLTLQYVPDPWTIFEDVYSLPAGHKLVIEENGPPKISRWWQLSFEPKFELSDDEAINEARTLLEKAVKSRLISEVPLGAFLSGGIDSSIIVALMARNSTNRVRTFSIGFEEPSYSETQFSRLVADRYQTDHSEFVFRPADLIESIEGVVTAFDQPFADPAALPLYALSKETRRHVTVVLSGDGGDETLAGYRRYILDRLLRRYDDLPALLTKKIVPVISNLIPQPAWIAEERNPVAGLRKLAKSSADSHKASLIRWGSYFDHAGKVALYQQDFYETLDQRRTEHWLSEYFDRANARGFLDRTLSSDQETYLAGDLLPKTDRVTMAHSLEARAPFLDRDWVEWTARLPEKFKVRGLTTKWLVKKAFRDMVPGEIVRRSKQGFGIPVGTWLRCDLREWARERLAHNSAMEQYFQDEIVTGLWHEHQAGRSNHSYRLWALVMFSIWHEQYISR